MNNESFQDSLNREHDRITCMLGHQVRVSGGDLTTPMVKDCLMRLEALEELSKKFWGTSEFIGILDGDGWQQRGE